MTTNFHISLGRKPVVFFDRSVTSLDGREDRPFHKTREGPGYLSDVPLDSPKNLITDHSSKRNKDQGEEIRKVSNIKKEVKETRFLISFKTGLTVTQRPSKMEKPQM